MAFATAAALAVLARRPAVARLLRPALAPLLATPHAAAAIGLAFLLAPSGWLARLAAPLLGWARPPDYAVPGDPWGLTLIAGLWLKETPYLLLMILAALVRVDPAATLGQAAGMGYGPWRAWIFAVLPRLWPQLRLPVMASTAFALSVVDVALILGPSDPPTLAVLVLRRFTDPDLQQWFPASAGAVLLAAIVLAALALQAALARLLAGLGRHLLRRGHRGGSALLPDLIAGSSAATLAATGGGALAVLALWSFAAAWRFPDALPSAWTTATWRVQAPELLAAAGLTFALAAAATLLALALAIAGLEHERRGGRPPGRLTTLLYLPLLVPQIAFLFGLQAAFVRLHLDGSLLALLWAHLLFVLPYVTLSLADPWRALDARYLRSAACLGAPPWRVLLRVALPLLARPIAASAAVGFAVSCGLYLPTLFAGAGRFDSLTTLAVAASAGADRRIAAVTASLQALLPMLAYALAIRRSPRQ